VSSYPTAGCTGPVRPAETFALAVAEVMGSALILRECLEVKVAWEVAAYSFDLRGLAMSYGSPEGLLLEIASREVNAYFHGERWWPHLYNTGSTLAKLPDPQAGAEKMSYMTMAALWGATVLPFAGCLSYSEVFSPMQLLADLEMKDHVERLVQGLDTGCDPEACLEDVRTGMESGFISLDRTLDLYRDLYWHPRLFDRRFLGPWKSDSCPSFERRAREMIRVLVARHDYEPAADVRKEIGRIYRRAEQELASASPTSG
jgi:trimethylamine--corrinoid protein Co-methyltransferase